MINLKLLSFISMDQSGFVLCDDIKYSHCDIKSKIANLFLELKSQGLSSGHRVVAILDNDIFAVIFMLVASALGLEIVMPYNLEDAAINEWLYIIDKSNPNYVVFAKKNCENLSCIIKSGRKIISININQLKKNCSIEPAEKLYCKDSIRNFLILFTSGTTASPKAISISEALICYQVRKVSKILKFHNCANIMMSGLMNNTTGFIFSLGAFLHKANLYFPKTSNVSEWPDFVEINKITHLMLRPVMLSQFLQSCDSVSVDVSSIQVLAYGAAAVPSKIIDYGRRLISCEWVQGYGLSETFGPFCWLTENQHEKNYYNKLNYCLGKPDDSVSISIKVTDNNESLTGEIVVKGDRLMNGYYDFDKNEIEKPNGCFHTGDYGLFTKEGFLVLKGRVKNTIISQNGHKIYPQEIESLIYRLDFVEEAVLIPCSFFSDVRHTAVLCIYIKNRLPKDFLLREIKYFLLNYLSSEKLPDYIYLSNSPFPKNYNGKIENKLIHKIIKLKNLVSLRKGEYNYAKI